MRSHSKSLKARKMQGTVGEMGGAAAIRKLPLTDRLEAAIKIADERGREKAKQRCAAHLIVKGLVERADEKLNTSLLKGGHEDAARLLERAGRFAHLFGLPERVQDRIRARLSIAYGVIDREEPGIDYDHFYTALGSGMTENDARLRAGALAVAEQSMRDGRKLLAAMALEMAANGIGGADGNPPTRAELASRSAACYADAGSHVNAFRVAHENGIEEAGGIGLFAMRVYGKTLRAALDEEDYETAGRHASAIEYIRSALANAAEDAPQPRQI